MPKSSKRQKRAQQILEEREKPILMTALNRSVYLFPLLVMAIGGLMAFMAYVDTPKYIYEATFIPEQYKSKAVSITTFFSEHYYGHFLIVFAFLFVVNCFFF